MTDTKESGFEMSEVFDVKDGQPTREGDDFDNTRVADTDVPITETGEVIAKSAARDLEIPELPDIDGEDDASPEEEDTGTVHQPVLLSDGKSDITTMSDADLLRFIFKIRAHKETVKRKIENVMNPIDSDEGMAENEFLRRMNDRQADSIGVKGIGRVQRNRTQHFNVPVADFMTYWNFVRKNNRHDMIPKKPNSTAVKDWLEQSKGRLPPGVTMTVKHSIKVVKT